MVEAQELVDGNLVERLHLWAPAIAALEQDEASRLLLQQVRRREKGVHRRWELYQDPGGPRDSGSRGRDRRGGTKADYLYGEKSSADVNPA
jgi:hypothetical protein